MATESDDTPRTVARQKIIETAQLNCYEARSQCIRVKSQMGDVPREYLLAFQDAILDYYWALKPLADEPPVHGWWEEVELSDQWTVASDGGDGDETGFVTGVDSIDGIEDDIETVRERKKTVRGLATFEHQQQRVLPFQVLKDISGVLDEATGRLGFIPATPTPVETDPEPI